MAKLKITGKTSVKVKKKAKKFVGGKGDAGFISGTIKAAVKKKKTTAKIAIIKIPQVIHKIASFLKKQLY